MASLGHDELTHWPLTAACPVKFLIRLQLVNESYLSALVEVMAWHRKGDKPLPEPMMTQFTDAHMRHKASMSKELFIWLQI